MKRYVNADGTPGPVIEPQQELRSEASADTPLRLLSWNLRYDSQPNTIPLNTTLSSLPSSIPPDANISYYSTPSEAPWSTRRIGVARELSFTNPDIIGVQEALLRQVKDLSSLLGSTNYARIGIGRDDGKEAGEFEAIYYKKDVLRLDSWDTFWLSDTPFSPSKYQGAGSYRTATVANFTIRSTGRRVNVFCTHWDDQSDAQRRVAASLIRVRAAWESSRTQSPVFVLGDFNSPSDGKDAGGYDILTGEIEPVPINQTFAEKYYVPGAEKWVMKDVAIETPAVGRSGHHATFTGFREWRGMDLKRIDFVMAGVPPTANHTVAEKKKELWRAERYRVGETWFDDEPMLSDHRPVWVDVVVGGK